MDEPKESKRSDAKALVDRRDFLGGATALAGSSLLGLASAAPTNCRRRGGQDAADPG